jgi:hypothetical protein
MSLKKRLLLASQILVATLLFTNCQNVNFENLGDPLAGNNVVDPNPENPCEPGSDCPDVPPTNPVNKSLTVTVPTPVSKIDVLLVLDNSQSMTAENLLLAQRLGGLVSILNAGNNDWQMCHTTTDVRPDRPNFAKILEWKKNNGSGAPTGTGLKVLSRNVADLQNIFNTSVNALGANGSSNEQGIAATRLVINNAENSSCFRNDAALAVVILSDEDERSCGGRCQFSTGTSVWSQNQIRDQYSPLSSNNSPSGLVDFVKATWPSKAFTAHSIVIQPGDLACWEQQDQQAPAFYGIEYQKLQSLTGGVLGSVCASDYAAAVENIAVRIIQSLASITLECQPVANPAPQVTFTPASAAQTYTVEGNKLLFAPAVTSGTEIRVNYTCLL